MVISAKVNAPLLHISKSDTEYASAILLIKGRTRIFRIPYLNILCSPGLQFAKELEYQHLIDFLQLYTLIHSNKRTLGYHQKERLFLKNF